MFTSCSCPGHCHILHIGSLCREKISQSPVFTACSCHGTRHMFHTDSLSMLGKQGKKRLQSQCLVPAALTVLGKARGERLHSLRPLPAAIVVLAMQCNGLFLQGWEGLGWKTLGSHSSLTDGSRHGRGRVCGNLSRWVAWSSAGTCRTCGTVRRTGWSNLAATAGTHPQPQLLFYTSDSYNTKGLHNKTCCILMFNPFTANTAFFLVQSSSKKSGEKDKPTKNAALILLHIRICERLDFKQEAVQQPISRRKMLCQLNVMWCSKGRGRTEERLFILNTFPSLVAFPGKTDWDIPQQMFLTMKNVHKHLPVLYICGYLYTYVFLLEFTLSLADPCHERTKHLPLADPCQWKDQTPTSGRPLPWKDHAHISGWILPWKDQTPISGQPMPWKEQTPACLAAPYRKRSNAYLWHEGGVVVEHGSCCMVWDLSNTKQALLHLWKKLNGCKNTNHCYWSNILTNGPALMVLFVFGLKNNWFHQQLV